ncbi:MAG: hypothetical protein L6Q99_11280 [Planctomycetes bacterium]|nr:hypothetical protein [Planctomycetota bacterium]
MTSTEFRFVRRASAWFAALTLGASAAPAQQCTPDAFEPNESCAALANVAPGLHAGLTLPTGGADFYRVGVPAAHRLEARVTLAQSDPSFFGLFRIWRDDGSAVPCDAPEAQVAFELLELGKTQFLLSWSADTNAPSSFVVSLESVVGACATYTLDLAVVPDPCAQLAADAFEPNDACATPAALGPGSYPNLTVGVGDLDFYDVTVPGLSLATLDVGGLAAGDELEVFAWSSASSCGDPNQASAGNVIAGPATGRLFLANWNSTPRSFVVRVTPRPNQASQSGFCGSYSLDVTSTFDPCGVLTGDPFEPNSVCSSAPLLTSSVSDLSIAQDVDLEWYSIDVPAHSTLRLVTASHQANVQRPTMLFSGCAGNPDFLMSSHPLDFGVDPRHILVWTNPFGAPVSTKLLVIRPTGALFCDVYDIELEFTLGTPFCNVSPNSTGEAARLSANGSTTPGVGTLTLSAGPVPAAKSGLVIMSTNTKPSTPFGKGYLCLSAPIVRFPVTTTGGGTLVTTLDWTGASSSIQPGDTWQFQTWFRDPAGGGAGFNLSEGLSILFQ